MVETTQARLRLALRAASEIAALHGLAFERAIVLQNLSNVIVHLAPTSVVARVSTTTATVRVGDAWFAREVAVARHLTAAGAPIIPLSAEIEPGPHQHLGLVLSFWKFVQILDQPFDPFQAGRALRVCHAALEDFQGTLPILALISEAQQLLDQLIAQSEFDAIDVEMLSRVSQRVAHQMQQLPMQPLHDDPHSGNVLNTTHGVVWTDWEDVMIGPVEWDLASLVAAPWVFGTDRDKAEVALDGYGRSFSDEALNWCIEARTFVALVWSIILHRQHPSLERQARIERRLQWFRDRER
ncbi:aminoglycoside phosphotransferase family protein [Pseudanabaenaceae cyanobacterium LEGE 13415]|nr:aminoglycoside phosphotransferase family protein [Pseudanabaenaceae cyanobacterium LEGE 13415]